MKTQHTPGPWEIGAIGQNDFNVITTAIDAPYAEPNEILSFCEVYGDSEEDKANARLIASAPELLEALEELAEQVAKDCSISSDPKFLEMLGKWNNAANIIKKAKGL